MTRQTLSNRAIPLLLLIACLLGFATDTAAQTENLPITLTTQVGLDGFRKGQGWLPIQVTMANEGPGVSGQLVIATGSNRPVYTAAVELPNQSNKRIDLNVFLDSFSERLTLRLVDHNGNTLIQTNTDIIRTLDQNSLLFGVVSPNPDSLTVLTKVTAGRSEAAVAFLTFDDLPGDKLGWRDLDVLILNDVDSNQLDAAQRAALESWLNFGGQLVVTGGANWQKTTTALANLLPVTPNGSESFSDLPSLAADAGQPFRDPGPYVVTTSSLRDGVVLFREGGLPLLARRSVGRGSVFFLALDPQFAPLDDWDGSELLWSTVASFVPRTPVWGAGFRNETEVSEAVQSLPSLTLPSPILLVCFLFTYILIIGPINYIVLNRMHRKELAWVSIPITIILFSLVAYIAGFQIKGNRVIINQMSLAYGRADATDMLVESALGIYSPRRASYDIILEPDTAVRPLAYGFGPTSEDVTIERGANVIIRDTLVDVGGVDTYAVSAVRPRPPIGGGVKISEGPGGTTLEVTVTNNANFTLENAMLLNGTSSIRLGDLAPGATATKSFKLSSSNEAALQIVAGQPTPFQIVTPTGSSTSPLSSHYATLLGTSSYYTDRAVFPRFKLLEALGEGYSASPPAAWRPLGVVTLIGWADQPQLGLALGRGNHEDSATTLYFIELPFAD